MFFYLILNNIFIFPIFW